MTTNQIHRDGQQLVLTSTVLNEARSFFESCGSQGREGTALIAGSRHEASRAYGDTLIIPDQVATPVPRASVTVTPVGDLQVATVLRADQRYLARIHSHPGLAFHSPTDDVNPALTHQGAVSIVVPFFGLGLRRGLDACAIYVLEGREWREIPVGHPERRTRVNVDD
jgi:hypothetical protein